MCEPVSLVVGASLLSAVTSIYGQQQQQSAQMDYQSKLMAANEQQMVENRDIATKAYLDQAAAANVQLAESREATAAANFDQARKGEEARGAALASASEAGVFGVSLTGLLDDFHRQEAMFTTRNEQNLVFKQQQTASAVRGYHTEAAARTAKVKPYQPGPVAPVDYIGPILKVAQTGGSAWMNYDLAAKKEH